MFIDLKKAFDTVDHIILFDKHDHYGVRGVAKQWLSTYLCNRKQYVCFNGMNLSYSTVTCGVPQGSILGPTLFIMYINDLCNVSSHLKSILFADDTSFFVEGSNLLAMCTNVSTEMNKLYTWFKINKLTLNLSKTNFMVFGHTNAPCEYNISIDNINIEQVNYIKFLGIYTDCKLTWSQHVNTIHIKLQRIFQ